MRTKTLLFSLLGGLPLAGLTGYAANEVQLKGGKTIDWSAFVEAINDPTTIKGEVAADNAAKQAYDQAEKDLEAANDLVETKTTEKADADADVTTAEGDLETANNTLEEKQGLLATAQKAVVNAQGDIDTYVEGVIGEKEDAYNEAKSEVDAKQAQIDELTEANTKLQASIDQAQADITAATQRKDGFEANLATLPKVTVISNLPWLETIYKNQVNFKASYDAKTDDDSYIYYKYVSEEDEMEGGTVGYFYISYDENPGDYFGPIKQSAFRDLFVTTTTNPNPILKGKPLTYLYLYLGAGYAALNNGATTDLVTSFTHTPANILISSGVTIKELTKDEAYRVETPTDTYKDPAAAALIQGKIDAEQKNIETLTEKKDADTATKSANETQITTYEGELKNLQKTADEKETEWNNSKLEGGVTPTEELSTALTDAQAEASNAQTAVDEAQADVDAKTTALTTAQTEATEAQKALDDANAAVVTAQGKLTAAEADLAAAQTAADNAARANYNEITLLDDVTVTTPITEKFTGTIYGEDHIITIPSGVLFNNFSGEMAEVGINGNLYKSTSSSASYTNVAIWNNGEGEFYNNKGVSTEYTALDELGFAARSKFGVNFTDKELVAKTPETTVYSITVYATPTSAVQSYVTAANNKFIGKNGEVKIPVNTFAKSATNDLKGFNNVIYQDGENMVCDYAVLTDKNGDFYAPCDFIAKEVSYDRTFNNGYNAVVLPFDLKYEASSNIKGLCVFDEETANNEFFFAKEETMVAANTPMLLVAEGSFELDGLKDANFKQTPASQIVEYDGNPSDPSTSYGLFKYANATGIVPSSIAGYSLYGLSGGEFRPVGTSTYPFPTFRMVLYSNVAEKMGPNGNGAPRRIVVRDSKGVIIPGLSDASMTVGIDNVAEEYASLNVAGGQGEIIINAEADYGKVNVYTVDGHVAAVANVVAGSNTVDNLQKGIYIVMGKKVMVK